MFAPFLGSSSIPPRIKGGLALALTLLLYPVCGRPLNLVASGFGCMWWWASARSAC